MSAGKLHVCRLADNVCLFAEFLDLLVQVLEVMATEAASLALEVKRQKHGSSSSKVEPLSIVLRKEVWVVEDFVYLGTVIYSSIQSSPDILRCSAFMHTAMQSMVVVVIVE